MASGLVDRRCSETLGDFADRRRIDPDSFPDFRFSRRIELISRPNRAVDIAEPALKV
jgi:hypothetical protein